MENSVTKINGDLSLKVDIQSGGRINLGNGIGMQWFWTATVCDGTVWATLPFPMKDAYYICWITETSSVTEYNNSRAGSVWCVARETTRLQIMDDLWGGGCCVLVLGNVDW